MLRRKGERRDGREREREKEREREGREGRIGSVVYEKD